MDILTVDGVYANSRVELLEKPEGVTKARVRVTFLLDEQENTREAARQRAFARMRAGIDFGGVKFDRAELYAERRQEEMSDSLSERALVDTNVVIYAHDPTDPIKHETAQQLLETLSDASCLTYPPFSPVSLVNRRPVKATSPYRGCRELHVQFR